MKTPLSIYALYHSENGEGAKIYSSLYSLLCRDTDNPFSDGLDIPVYYATGDDNGITHLANANSNKRVILLFIDINMFCSPKWKRYIADLYNTKDDNTVIVGVKQFKHSFSINTKLGDVQSIVVDPNKDIDNIQLFEGENWEIFTTQIFDLLIRLLTDTADKKAINVFISHSKQDKTKKGVKMAEEVRQFLYANTKLNSFFDVHDILDGYKFGDQIIRNVGNSALLILFTDSYSSREWCRIEALTAKKHHVPIVVVFMLEGKVDRIFPYIGNIPSTIFDGNWRKVINLLLRTTLDQTYESKMLESLCTDETIAYLPYPPEAFNLSLLNDKTAKLVYPEPPLGNEELDVMKGICTRMKRNIQFFTPMSYQTQMLDLKQQYIGISISDGGELDKYGVGKEMFKDLTIELCRHILKANGKIIYGGNLSKGGYTELFRDLSRQYGQREKEDADVMYFRNYLSWPLYNDVTLSQKAEYLNSRIELISADSGENVSEDEQKIFILPSSFEDQQKWASSLTSMRKQMISNSIARVIVGGKTKSFTGYMAGIAEEFLLSVKGKHPVYLIGGFGGASHAIVEILEKNATSDLLLTTAMEDESYRKFYEWLSAESVKIDYKYLDGLNVADLNNGLSAEQNMRLFHSVDIIEIVSLILEGLSNISNIESNGKA